MLIWAPLLHILPQAEAVLESAVSQIVCLRWVVKNSAIVKVSRTHNDGNE